MNSVAAIAGPMLHSQGCRCPCSLSPVSLACWSHCWLGLCPSPPHPFSLLAPTPALSLILYLWSWIPANSLLSEGRPQKAALVALQLDLPSQSGLQLNLLADISHSCVGTHQLSSKCTHDSHVFEEYVEEEGQENQREMRKRGFWSCKS